MNLTPLHGFFRENVQRIIVRRGITQTQLAEAMGVTQGFISQILTGYRNVGLETVDSVAKALDVEPSTLLKPPAPRRARSA